MQILYGTPYSAIDVTSTCFTFLTLGNIISIPFNDNTRSALFTDPMPGTSKYIIVVKSDQTQTAYDDKSLVFINILDENITTLGYGEALGYSS